MRNEKRSVNIPHRFIDGSATITEVRTIADEDDPHILLIQDGDCIAIRPESWPEIRDAVEEMLPNTNRWIPKRPTWCMVRRTEDKESCLRMIISYVPERQLYEAIDHTWWQHAKPTTPPYWWPKEWV